MIYIKNDKLRKRNILKKLADNQIQKERNLKDDKDKKKKEKKKKKENKPARKRNRIYSGRKWAIVKL